MSTLASKIARGIMEVGDCQTPCQRIQFKGGIYPDSEIDQGGLCEESLAGLIQSILDKEYMRDNFGPTTNRKMKGKV